MYGLKPIARPAAILIKSTLLMGLLATTSITTAYEADAAGYYCRRGLVRYHGHCMTHSQRERLRLAAQAAAQPNMCPMTLPVTGQVVNVPCAAPAPSTGKTCPLQIPITGQVVQVPC